MWLDDCRIPFLTDEGYNYKNGPRGNSFSVGQEPDGKRTEPVKSNDNGRFTPNLLVCDDMLNDGIISKSVKSKRGGVVDSNSGTYSWNNGKTEKIENYMCGVDDKGTNSRYYNLDLWFDNMLDRL